MAVWLIGNKSPDSNRLTLITPKFENDVRLQVILDNQNPSQACLWGQLELYKKGICRMAVNFFCILRKNMAKNHNNILLYLYRKKYSKMLIYNYKQKGKNRFL